MKERNDLRVKVAMLEEKIEHQRERIRLLIAEVAFVENGYGRKPES